MKMKSNVLGISAKLVLAVLVVCGTIFTSCYEEKGVDVTPVKPATYIVAGGVYDDATNAAIEGYTVSISPTVGTATVTGYSFRITGLSANDVITITVVKEGYFTASRSIEIGVGAAGTTVVVNASIALTSKASESVPAVDPEGGESVPTTSPDLSSSATLTELGLLGLTSADGSALAFDADGDLTAQSQTALSGMSAVAIDQYVPVKVERYEDSFVITDVQTATTKAITSVDASTLIYLARCVASAIDIPYAGAQFSKIEETVNILQSANMVPYAYQALMSFSIRSLNFIVEGQTYVVTYMSCKTTSYSFLYDTHDNHDSHDGHGGNSNAGGGIGGSDL